MRQDLFIVALLFTIAGVVTLAHGLRGWPSWVILAVAAWFWFLSIIAAFRKEKKYGEESNT